jgi:hypothetical protein
MVRNQRGKKATKETGAVPVFPFLIAYTGESEPPSWLRASVTQVARETIADYVLTQPLLPISNL